MPDTPNPSSVTELSSSDLQQIAERAQEAALDIRDGCDTREVLDVLETDVPALLVALQQARFHAC